jgi:hypothetical protein
MDDRGTNEHGPKYIAIEILNNQVSFEAVYLSAEGIPCHLDIQQAQWSWFVFCKLSGHHYQASTCSPDWDPRSCHSMDWLSKLIYAHEAAYSSALATRDNQSINPI